MIRKTLLACAAALAFTAVACAPAAAAELIGSYNAWLSRAEAFAVAGDLPAARKHVERALAIHAGDDDGDDSLILQAALAGDRARLDREIGLRFKRAPDAFPEYFGYLRSLCP